MRTFDDVFSAFDGPAAFARAIGVEPGHGQQMKNRHSIPPAYWPATVKAAEKQRIHGITLESLAMMAVRQAQSREQARAS